MELLYQLDTAVMLIGVFLEEAPDPVLARKYITRAGDLAEALRRVL